jgi:hypothetical protein
MTKVFMFHESLANTLFLILFEIESKDNFLQHCFICRPSDSDVFEDAGIELNPGVLQPETHIKRQATRHACLPWLQVDAWGTNKVK